jgi:hypothetical protein
MLETGFSPFTRRFPDPAAPLTRIGQGEVGGKARGLASISDVLNTKLNTEKLAAVTVDIPPLAVLGTQAFDAFMERNNLYEIAGADLPDERIARAFQRADLPFDVLGDLRALVSGLDTPLAVRSSSLLEDAVHEPFAGIYATKMIPNSRHDPDLHFQQLVAAVKFVYASAFSRRARDYRSATGHSGADERMAIIIQELVGKRYHRRFYPELSGVARSYNYYPMGPAKPEEGVVSLALGLGKTVVDGGVCWSYSPAHPKVGPPFSSVENLLKETQTEFWVVNMGEPAVFDPTQETEYLLLEDLTAAERDGTLRHLVSTYSPLSGRLSIGTGFPGPRALTFAPLLVLDQIPLNDVILDLLRVCETALSSPVEIEFAMTFNPHRFRFLQVRRMRGSDEETDVPRDELNAEDLLVASETALGNGVVDTVCDVIYTKPESFELRHTPAMVPELECLNRKLLDAGRSYVLITLGRLGTTDPWLGIPVNWGKISGARVVVEVAQENARVELSQGSHYFHNIVSLGVKYFNLPFSHQHKVDWNWLEGRDCVDETRFLRHVRLPEPLRVRVDGHHSRGVIYKPLGATNE